MKSLTFALVFALLSFACSGCMALGAGVGAAVPRYAETDAAPSVGEDVRVSSTDGTRVSGRVTSVDAQGIEVTSDARPVHVTFEQVAHLERRAGTYALRGFEIGAAIDGSLTLATVVLALFAHSMGQGFSAMGAM